MTELRTRTHSWLDAQALAAETREIAGIDYYRAWSEGKLVPPMAATLGFTLAGYGDGFVEIVCSPSEFHYSPYGMAHGGLASTLLDSATGCAVHTQLPAGTGYATLNLNVGFMRPVTMGSGVIRCRGEVISSGRRVAVSEATLVDEADRKLAHATSTCLILSNS